MTPRTSERTAPTVGASETVVERRLRSVPTAAAAARRSLDLFRDRLTPSLLDNAKLLVSELVTNAVRHGPHRANAEVRLRAAVGADVVRVEVMDEGRGFRPPPASGLFDAGGWGLVLVERVADRWGIENGGPTRVWFELDRAAPERPRLPVRPTELDTLQIALDAGRMGTWDWDMPSGAVRWSESLERIHGLEPGTFGGRFDDFRADMHPEDRAGVLGSIERAVREGRDYAVDYRILRRSDGAVRWLTVRGRVLHDENGRPTGMAGVCADITERKDAERSLAVQYAVARVLSTAPTVEDATPVLVGSIAEALGWEVGTLWRADEDAGVLRYVGGWSASPATGDRFLAKSREFLFEPGIGLPGRVWSTGRPAWIPDVGHDDNFPRAPFALEASLHAAFAFPITLGREVLGVMELYSRRIREPDEGLLDLMSATGAQIGQYLERQTAEAELVESERVAHERTAFLADASMTLGSSLDPRKTLTKVARMVVPDRADWCRIDIREHDGSIQPGIVHHADPEKGALAHEYLQRYPLEIGDPLGVAESIESGEPQLRAELTPETLERLVPDPEQRAMLRELGVRSTMIVPLFARGRAFGAITQVSAGRPFGRDDLEQAQELAHRAALAIDNARLYEERAHIARTLQKTLLPRHLLEIPGLEVAAHYQAAGITQPDIGGDFYDVFEAGEGAWGVVVGDVCGKGVEAAALTGMARHTLRTSAFREPSPGGALRDLNRMMLREDGERFCTVALARLETNGRGVHLTVACGGHPSPIVLRSRGGVETIGAPGSLLGVFEDVEFVDRSTELAPGDLAVFFTDGLIDPRHPTPLEERGVLSLVEGCAGLTAQQTVDRIADAIADPGAQTPDDVCVLAIRVAP